MKQKQKKYILNNLGDKSIGEVATALGLKEKKIKEFTESPEYKLLVKRKNIRNIYIWSIGLLLIFSAALGIRLNRVINFPETYRYGLGLFGDSNAYHAIAYNLYKGNGFSSIDGGTSIRGGEKEEGLVFKPAITRGPVYPFFVYLIYKFFGIPEEELSQLTWYINWDRVRIAQCILDSFCCVLIFFIARAIQPKSLWSPLVASGIYGFSFYNIYYTKTLLAETLATFLVTSFILISILMLKNRTLHWSLFTGLAFGFIPLCRPEYVLFAPILALFIFFVNKENMKIAIVKAIICLAGVAIVILPWSFRNYIVFKKPIPISKGGLGEGLYWGTIHTTSKNWKGWGELPDDGAVSEEEKRITARLHQTYFLALRYGDVDQIQKFDDAYIKLAIKRIQENPIRTFKNWVLKIPRLWYQNYIPKYPTKEAKGWFFLFYLLFALYAFFTENKEGKISMLPVCLLFIYITLIFMPFEVEPRYGVALMPGVISLTAIGVCNAITKLGSKER